MAEPETPAPSERLVNVFPPSVETCHWHVGAGLPPAATVKIASFPAVTVWAAGWVVIAGAVLTVRVAGVLVTELTLLVTVQSYWQPFIANVVPLSVKVAVAEPETPDPSDRLVKVPPPSVETFH